MVQQSQRREWRKRKKRRNRIKILLKILILILILCGIGYGGKKLYDIYNTNSSKGNQTSDKSNTTDSTNDTEETKNPEDTKETEQPKPTDIVDNPDINKKPDVVEEPDSTDKVDDVDNPDSTDKSDEVNKPDTTDKSNEVDKTDKTDGTKEPDNQKGNENTEKADESYFDDAVFIGDSRTEGFGMYSGLKNTTVYSEKGLTVDTIFKDSAVKINGTKVTIIDALKNKSFGKVYIMLGVNELGWPYDDVFIDRYRKVIDAIKESQPNAEICIQSIIHVSKEKDKNPPSYINNKLISRRNELIKKMAEEENVNYLDLNPVLTDSSGYLFTEASTDGIHLNQKYCLVWKDYLLQHTLN